MLSVIRNGMLLAIAATTDPSPRLTSRIGNAQQSRVPVEANKTNQPHFFVDVRFLFIVHNRLLESDSYSY